MPRILIVDDDEQVCETMASLVRRQGHLESLATDVAGARQYLESVPFDVVFLDVRLPDGNGLDLLPLINSLPEAPEVIILTGKGDPDGAELAIQRGVWDYLLKPSSTKEISLSLKRALKYRQEKRGEADGAQMDMSRVVGVSPTLRTLLEKVAMAGRSEANVLITGETGTGKELFARTVHGNSNRVGGEFVVVDCASLTETLVESTLFGHRRGAFTGAQADHQGLVRMANKGTLFLDEVGEMPLSVQKSFLRVLQERSFRPVGETREVSSDFRLISATNKNLSRLVDQGRFREDLLFRLMTIHLQLPPLRERMEDIHPLADHHVARLCRHYNLPRKRIDQDVFQVLVSHDWPGNVRELFNVLERAFVASGRDPVVYPKHLPQEMRVRVTRSLLEKARWVSGQDQADRPDPGPALDPGPDQALPTFKEAKNMAEKHYLEALLQREGPDVQRLTEVSGLSRSHFYALLKRYGLEIRNGA